MTRNLKRIALAASGTIAVALVGIQLVPYGRDHTNPPVTGEPAWDSPETRALARRACFDCHSNETRWPVYASIAPFSWVVQDHVDEGREVLNFSEWDRPQEEAEEASEVVAEGEMPLWDYSLVHPESRLTPAERRALVDGLAATLGGEVAETGGHRGEGRERRRREGHEREED